MEQLTKFDELDFFEIRKNLIDTLSTKIEFQDHNFEGTVWSTMLDMMSYAIAYTGLYSNMALSESFLDSAQLRSSVVSRAKELNYFPRTIKASKAIIKLSIESDDAASSNLNSIQIPAKVKFSASDGNSSYIFTTTQEHNLNRVDLTNQYEGNIEIVEGEFLNQNWVIPSIGIDDNDLEITQQNVDSDYLTVDVRESTSSNNIEPYTYSKTLFQITSESPVFFLQETTTGNIAIFFGDNIIGKRVEGGNVVEASYLVTSGRDGNGIGTFELIQDIDSFSRNSFNIEAIERSTGGADRESIESIRFSAPRSFESQNRAVSAFDYEQMITERYGFIESINAWGGEENIPPQYGRVFISIKPFDNIFLSNAVKQNIEETVLQRFNIVGIVPEIVDPDVLYVSIKSNVLYDRTKLSGSDNQLISDIKSQIDTYFKDNLSRFNKTFQYSRLVATIDNTSSAISNNQTTTLLEKRFVPLGSSTRIYEHNFANELEPNSFLSNTITTNSGNMYYYQDDGNGNIFQYRNNVRDTLPIGTIDYINGTTQIIDFAFPWPSTENQELRFRASTTSQDVLIKHNNIIILGDVNISLESV